MFIENFYNYLDQKSLATILTLSFMLLFNPQFIKPTHLFSLSLMYICIIMIIFISLCGTDFLYN